MNVPWRFIVALPLGFILSISFFVAALYTQLGIPTHMSEWIFDITQKKEKIADQIPGHRLFLVAGSSTLFGINAKLIEEKTGYPTINMGTHAGLYVDYRLYQLKRVLRPGDTVLFAWEYQNYLDGFNFSAEYADDYILARDPEYFYQMSPIDKVFMATRLAFKRFQKGWHNRYQAESVRPPGKPYSPYTPISPGIDCLDDRGDQIFNAEATRPPIGRGSEPFINVLIDGIPSEQTTGFRALADFAQWAKAHDVRVLATFPAIYGRPEYNGPKGRQAIQTITHFYTSHGIPVIGTATEVMLPLDQFFDSMYHPTHEATLRRTERLIPEIQPYLTPNK